MEERAAAIVVRERAMTGGRECLCLTVIAARHHLLPRPHIGSFRSRYEEIQRILLGEEEQERREEGMIVRVSKEQVQELSRHAKSISRRGRPSESAPFNLRSNKPIYSNKFGNLYEITPDKNPQLEDLELSLSSVEINKDYAEPVKLLICSQLCLLTLLSERSGFSIPNGCKKTCLVAVNGSSLDETILFGSKDFKIGGFDGKFSLNKGYVAGILTVDTVADFLPRKGPLRQRRTGIAYISNVAVREKFRRKGIAKKLIANAESQARSWGCCAIALHCVLSNIFSPAAT